MGIYDRTKNWKKRALNIVNENLKSEHYALGNSLDFKYSTKYPFTKEHIVISYNHQHKVYIVWNALKHQNFMGNKKTLSLGANGKKIIRDKSKLELQNEIIPVPKQLHNSDIKCETVFIVGENALLDFCKHYEEYVFGNEICSYDENQIDELERKYIQVFRKQRDPNFRNKVLKKYDYTCIVCGCKETTILQAAHIVSVESGGSDDASNGYCLCANHHLMFDAKILNIDMETGTFSCENTSEVNAEWYKEAQKRDFKLKVRRKSKCRK